MREGCVSGARISHFSLFSPAACLVLHQTSSKTTVAGTMMRVASKVDDKENPEVVAGKGVRASVRSLLCARCIQPLWHRAFLRAIFQFQNVTDTHTHSTNDGRSAGRDVILAATAILVRALSSRLSASDAATV
jgi:hypothetical protein